MMVTLKRVILNMGIGVDTLNGECDYVELVLPKTLPLVPRVGDQLQIYKGEKAYDGDYHTVERVLIHRGGEVVVCLEECYIDRERYNGMIREGWHVEESS